MRVGICAALQRRISSTLLINPVYYSAHADRTVLVTPAIAADIKPKMMKTNDSKVASQYRRTRTAAQRIALVPKVRGSTVAVGLSCDDGTILPGYLLGLTGRMLNHVCLLVLHDVAGGQLQISPYQTGLASYLYHCNVEHPV
jgi:hypothetical protein